jgi:hypothetical protein
MYLRQGQFAGLEVKDIEDIINAIVVAEAPAVWSGTDTSLTFSTTNQYMGLLAQITQQFVIAPGASIIDAIKAQVALMSANQTFTVSPTAIYLNPVTVDLIDREAKAFHIDLGTTNVGARGRCYWERCFICPNIAGRCLRPTTTCCSTTSRAHRRAAAGPRAAPAA